MTSQKYDYIIPQSMTLSTESSTCTQKYTSGKELQTQFHRATYSGKKTKLRLNVVYT